MKKILLFVCAFAVLLSLVACNNDKLITMSFETNEGSNIADIKAKAGEKISKPADPTKEGLTFGGWYADIDLLETYTFPEVMPEEDVTIYAKWVVTLTFNSNGGPSVDPIVQEGGKTFRMPADPQRDGYVFVGWFTDPAYTQRLTYVMPKTNTTAYARWQVYEVGSCIDVSLDLSDNDGCFILDKTDGVKITASEGKTEWGYCYSVIKVADSQNTTIKVDLIGKKDTNVTLKVEGGNAASATETTVLMTGEPQEVVWSCDTTNLSTVAGQKFLVFLNGGVVGCDATEAEWVKINSIKLYRTKDAEEEQKAAIYFVANGGSETPEIYCKAGEAIAQPADPTRDGYNFKGWFSDAAFTTPYTFTTMPATGAIVYAQWEKVQAAKKDVNLLGLAAAELTPDTYNVTVNADSYVISKKAAGGEWDCVLVPMPANASLGGYTYLRLEIVGPAGQKVLLKINDTYEIWHETNGKKQIVEYQFDLTFDMNKAAIILFANGGVAGESGEFTITKLAYGVESAYQTLDDAKWEVGENAACKFDTETDELIISKDSVGDDSMNWDCVKNFSEVSLAGFNRLHLTVKGTDGEQLLVKIFDTKEFWVDMTGEYLDLVFDFELDYDANKPALVLFPNGGADGTGHSFYISSILFEKVQAEGNEEVAPAKEADLIKGNFEIPAGNKAELVVKVSKYNAGDWDNVQIALPEVTGATKLNAKVIGPADKQILFKVNDQKEFWHTCTGELQDLSFDIEDLIWDTNRKAMILFPEGATAGTGGEFIISKLELVDGEDSYDLLKGTIVGFGCKAEVALEISKTAVNEWDCVKISTGLDLSEITTLEYVLRGTAGEQVLIKVNDAKEFWVNLTGEEQKATLDLAGLVFDKAKADIVLFANPGVAGTGNVVYITELKLLAAEEEKPEAPAEVNEIDGNVELGADYAGGAVLIVSKNNAGEWDNVQIALAEVDGATKLNIKIIGPADKQILLKVNDQKEFWHTCTGELQEVSYDIEGLSYDPARAAIVLFPEGAQIGSGEEFKIYALELENGEKKFDLMAGTINQGNCKAEKVLEIAKPGAGEWDCVKISAGKDLSAITSLEYTLIGTAGEQVLIKVNDAKEFWVNLTGELQSETLNLDGLKFDAAKADIVLFVNPGAAGTGHKVIISKLLFVGEVITPSTAVKEANIIEASPLIGGDHMLAEPLHISKEVAGEWENVQIRLDGVEGATKINISIIGPADKQVLLKVNDQKEFWHTCNGELQNASYDIEGLVYDPAKPTIVLFPEGAAAGTGCLFTIYSLELENGEQKYDLLEGSIAQGNCKAAMFLELSKVGPTEWGCIQFSSGLNLSEITHLEYTMKGTAGEQVLIKVNDSKEFFVTLTGEEQSATLDLEGLEFDAAKADVVIFVNPGVAGTQNKVIITKLLLVAQEN